MLERKKVDLGSYVFEVIEYDPTENPRGVVTSDEWNTILGLLKSSSNYTSKTLQEVFTDLYTAHELSSTEPGASGASLIGLEPIAGLTSTLDLKGNVNEALKELVLQIKDIALGAIPPNSIGSNQLESDLNFTGDTLTFNDIPILTEDYIAQSINSDSTDKTLASSKAIYNSLTLKQNNIEIGEEAPNENTEGNVYIQLENESIESYTKEEIDLLLSTKQTELTAGSNIKIENNVISATTPPSLNYASFVITTHNWGFNVHGGNWGGGSKTYEKSGYKCIAIAGYRRDGTNDEHYTASEHGAQITSNPNGKVTVQFTIKGTSDMPYIHGASGTIQLLWVKIS